MANQQIFCNTPWYEVHIYWDGGLGICCQENRRLSTDPKYNIKTMSLQEWFNSQPVRQLRLAVLSDTPTDICNRCYHEEQIAGTSRRHRANQKSVIFTHRAFKDSYEQSPGYDHFKLSKIQDGLSDTTPIDIHIDLGNYCNLACKMCWSAASSTIATQNVKWGVEEHRQYLGNDWTRDTTVWTRFLNELLDIPKLNNIHFMGGETLLTKRFEDLVDFFILHKRFDLCFSFVTNGTTYNQSLIDKLKKFTRVGMEVSIETITAHNSYIRQGTDTELVLANIQKYKENCDNSSISVTVRPAISALSIGNYHTLLRYCLEHQLIVKSLLVTDPVHLDVRVLPHPIKLDYMKPYETLISELADVDDEVEYNHSDKFAYKKSVKLQAIRSLSLLRQPSLDPALLKNMVEFCKKWDGVYNLDAIRLYPELENIFKLYGY